MDDANLQSRFEAALRRALSGESETAGQAVVNVAPAAVTVTPRIVAEFPALAEPLEILDVNAGAFGLRLRVTKRTESGSIDEVLIEPRSYHPLGDFK